MCLYGHDTFKHGLNLHAVCRCVNLQPGRVQSAPLRHSGIVGCRKGHAGFAQLGKNRQICSAWWLIFFAGDGCLATHFRFLHAAPNEQWSVTSMVVPGGAADD